MRHKYKNIFQYNIILYKKDINNLKIYIYLPYE
jgi:hypothetical protein